jgi:hypothetical protein
MYLWKDLNVSIMEKGDSSAMWLLCVWNIQNLQYTVYYLDFIVGSTSLKHDQ